MTEDRFSDPNDDFQQRRARWLEAIAIKLMAGEPWQESQDVSHAKEPSLSHIENAMLVAHVGLSHIYGLTEEDMTLGPYLSSEVAERTISRWRSGDFDPRLSSQLLFVWLSLFQVGRDTCTIRKSLLNDLANSALCRLLTYETEGNLRPETDPRLPSFIRQFYPDFEYPSPGTPEHGSYPLDIPNSHLSLVRHAQNDPSGTFEKLVSLLELGASYADDHNDIWNATALDAVRHRKILPLIFPGAWPRIVGAAPPSWVLEDVRTRGARFSYASSGYIPGWYLVMDSDDVARAVIRAGYETKFFYTNRDGRRLSFGFLLEFPDGTYSRIAYSYDLAYIDSINNLRTMLAMGMVRIDFYKLNPDSSLSWDHSIGRRLPFELISLGRAAVGEWTEAHPEPIEHPQWTVDGRLKQMALMERNLFERLTICQRFLREDPNSTQSAAYNQFLNVAHVVTVQRYAGQIVDASLYDEAVSTLHSEITKVAPALDPVDLNTLGFDKAYIQFYVVTGHLRALVAFNDPAHREICLDLDFPGKFSFLSTSASVRNVSKQLSLLLHELVVLQERNIYTLILSLGADIYNLPIHDALLDLGFRQVSYTHRLGSVTTPSSLQPNDGVCISGYAATKGDHLAALKHELNVLKKIYRSKNIITAVAHDMPPIAHWAGHGFHGFTAFEGGMQMGPINSDFVSSARVLAEYDCSSTSLVYLSACSTGRGEYGFDNLAIAIPMDVAFIEAGARAVLSTSAPVNDIVSAFFAVVFHFSIEIKRRSIWDAYALARICTQSQSLDPAVNDLGIILDTEWPSWIQDLGVASNLAPDDWRLFRLSGRFWP